MAEGRTAPGPRGDTLLGSTLDFKDHPLHYVQYLHRAYGDVVKFKVGFQTWFLVCRPDLIWEMTVTRSGEFRKPAVARKIWKDFLGDGLLTAEGDVWRASMAMMRPAFHRDRIHAYGEVMTEYTDRMIDGWTDGEDRDIGSDMVGLTLEVVAKTLFDADVHDGAPVVRDAMLVLQEVMVDHIHMPIPVPKWWPSAKNRRKVEAIEAIEAIVRDVIAERRASQRDHGDLLSMIVFAKGEDGAGMADREVRDQAMTLFFAGHETSSHALTWAWYLLSRHPHVVERMREELDAVVGERAPTVDDLKSLPYLEQVVKESLRILPSVWVFMKEPIEDTQLGGFHVPKGAQIMISPYVTQHDARWFPSPETFDPDRFHKERAKEIPTGAYVPFSAGQRVCLGKTFAMMEVRLILGRLVQRVDPVVAEGYEPVIVSELSMHPKDGMPVVVRMRNRG
jgi:cytochrome P450